MAEGWACRCSRGTLYEVLQVSPWCEADVIHAAYRALARTRHPDVNRDPDAEEQMRRLNAAYQVLSDPVRRTRYDEELALESGRALSVWPAPAGAPSARPASPRPAGSAGPAWSSPGWTPHASTVSPGPRRSRVEPSIPRVPPNQVAAFDARGDAFFPRSALYVSLALLTVILIMVVWLLIDAFADRPIVPARGPRVDLEQPWRQGSGPRTTTFGGSGPLAEPGLSSTGERWKR